MTGKRVIRINLEARAAAGEQRRARTRERLLDAAETVVAEKGIETPTIENFVAAAGVSRGTFYNYFPTVTDLLHALNARVAEGLAGRLDSVNLERDDPAAALAASLHLVVDNYAADPLRSWIAVQLAASRAPRQRIFENRFAATFDRGVASGRFRDVDRAAAIAVGFGTMRMALRDMLADTVLRTQSVTMVALILTAYGVPYEEAERISRDEAAKARSS